MPAPPRHPARRRFAAALVGALTLVVTVGAPHPPAQAQEDGDRSLKGEYDEVIGQEAALVGQLQAAQAEKARLQAELTDLTAKLDAAGLQLIDAQRALDRSVAARRAAQASLVRAQRKVVATTAALHRQAVDSYVNGGNSQPVVDALLNTRDGDKATRAVTYADSIVRNTNDVVRSWKQARARRDRTARAAADAQAAAARHRDDLRTLQASIARSRDEKQQLVAQVEQQSLVTSQALAQVQGRKLLVEGRINSMNRSSDSIQLTLAQLQAGQPDFTPGAVLLDDPVPGAREASPFGMRFHPILHIARLHAGVDLAAGTGTPIHAAADGLVVMAGVHGGYGNATVIDHGHSLATLYGHQSKILVQAGQFVKQGDVIGLVGSTGMSTGPHLHFETRIKGVPIDPLGLVTLR